jgi:hypothetical protein
MGWTLKDTMSLTPNQIVRIQEALYNLLKRENGEQDSSEKIKQAQSLELEKRLKSLKEKGIYNLPLHKLTGAMGR